MAYDLTVGFDVPPARDDWQAALDRAGIDLVLDRGDIATHTGFWPCRYDGQPTGFEVSPCDAEAMRANRIARRAGVTLKAHERVERRCAIDAAAALCIATDGLLSDPRWSEPFPAANLARWLAIARSALDLGRFETAQQPHIAAALAELGSGTKRTHWMWFVFPQLRGLGRSAMAERYGIASLDEARAFLADPMLGGRLLQCTSAVLAHEGRSLAQIFGSPDDVKFISSMTLFARATDDRDNKFREALERYSDGLPDVRTVALLADGDAG